MRARAGWLLIVVLAWLVVAASAAAADVKAELISPTAGSTLGASATFTWAPGIGAAEYSLAIGSSVGGTNVYSHSQGLNLTATVSTLPAGGGTLYVRLYTRFLTAGWQFIDYTFTAASGAKAELTSPTLAARWAHPPPSLGPRASVRRSTRSPLGAVSAARTSTRILKA